MKDASGSLTSPGSAFGASDWQAAAAKALGLESSLRPRGRPRQQQKK